MRAVRTITVVAAVGLALVGCTTGSDDSDDTARVVQLGPPGESPRELTSDDAASAGAGARTPTRTWHSSRA